MPLLAPPGGDGRIVIEADQDPAVRNPPLDGTPDPVTVRRLPRRAGLIVKTRRDAARGYFD